MLISTIHIKLIQNFKRNNSKKISEVPIEEIFSVENIKAFFVNFLKYSNDKFD